MTDREMIPGSWMQPSGPGAMPYGRRPHTTRPRRVAYWVTFGLLCAVAAGLIAAFFATAGAVIESSAAMVPAIQPGDKVDYQHGAGGLVRGDVVLIRVPGTGLVLKRVIGLPGDSITCCDSAGRMAIDRKALTEDYLQPGVAPSQVKFTVVTGPGQVWVMGDNRTNSYDSRELGPQRMSDIVGRVIMVHHDGLTLLRTPAAFTAAGLAPADHRVPLVLPLAVFASLTILAAIGQGTVGLILWDRRRRVSRR